MMPCFFLHLFFIYFFSVVGKRAGEVTRGLFVSAPFYSTASEVRKGCFRASSADIRRPGCMASNASNLVGKDGKVDANLERTY